MEATVALHSTVGPARTTISAIAARAGVQRHTVYAHFGDARDLFRACSSHWLSLNPRPDPSGWWAIEEPEEQLRTALDAVYAYYERVEAELAPVRRDFELVPAMAERAAAWAADWAALRDGLTRRWGLRGARRRRLAAAIGHALDFEAWRSLFRRQGLERAQAVELMVRLAAAV